MRFKFITLLCLFTSFMSKAQVEVSTKTNKYLASSIPNELLTKDATAVVREYSEVFAMQTLDKVTTHIHEIITILTKGGEKHGRFFAYYDKLRKVSNITGKLYGANGVVIKKLKSSDIQDIGLYSEVNFADDNRAKIAEFNYGQFPYTVEFDYDVEANGSIGKETWQPQDSRSLSVENSYYEIHIPESVKLDYKAFNLENPKPQIFRESIGKQTYDIYRWTASNLKAYSKLHFLSSKNYELPTLIATFNHFKYDGYEANASSWEEYGRFFFKLNEGRDKLPDAFKAELKNMVKDCPTPLSKVEKLYDYLQKNTRYVSIQFGIGGFQPFPAIDVCTKRYGDCKGLSNFMYSMLKEVGVPSFYTLAGAGEDHTPMQRDLVGDYFNHVFLCVPIEKDTVWLECTSSTNPAGYCSNFTGDRDVLLITPEGGKIAHTPQYKEKENVENRKAQLKLDEEGNVIANVTTQYSGLKQEMPNNLANHNDTKDVQNYYYSNLKLPNFNIKNFKFDVEKKRIPVVTEQLDLSVNQYASKSGKRLFLQPNILNKYNQETPDTTGLSSHKGINSIVAGEMAFTENDTFEWDLPVGFGLEHMPESVTFQSIFGEYQANVSVKDNKLIYSRKLVINNEEHPVNTLTDLIAFYQNIEKSDKMKVVLVKK